MGKTKTRFMPSSIGFMMAILLATCSAMNLSDLSLQEWIVRTDPDRTVTNQKVWEWLEAKKITTVEKFLDGTSKLKGTGVTIGMKQVFRAVGIAIRTNRVQRARQARQSQTVHHAPATGHEMYNHNVDVRQEQEIARRMQYDNQRGNQHHAARKLSADTPIGLLVDQIVGNAAYLGGSVSRAEAAETSYFLTKEGIDSVCKFRPL